MDVATLWAGRMANGSGILQVTHGVVLLINGDDVQKWRAQKRISLVAVNDITGMSLLSISFSLLLSIKNRI